MSYSTVANALAFTRHLLDGETTFNSTTRPTGTEVNAFINRVSAHLDLALAASGFSTPVTTASVRPVLDDWVTQKTVQYIELTQRGEGFNDGEGSRSATFGNLAKSAMAFVAEYRQGFINLGLSVSHPKSEGLQFTALDAQADRADPDDSTLEQPAFTRHMFEDES